MNPLIQVLMVVKNNLKNFVNGRIKLALCDNISELESHLTFLGINRDNIECIGCKKNLNLKEVRGLYKYNGEIFAFCNDASCEIEASHKLLN